MRPSQLPILAILSLVLPVGGAVYALRLYARSSADTMGAAIGQWLAAYLVFAVACGLGEVAAIASLIRGERPGWLGLVGVLLNLTAAIPPILLLIRKAP